MDVDTAATCALAWATDSNALVCTTVVPNGVAAVKGVDLSTGTYHTNAVAATKLQIAKGTHILSLREF